jgi:FixJ family two-component response regulator
MTAEHGLPTVCLVDDNPQVLKAQARLLREHGFRTALFPSAEAFLAQHDARTRGCLVLDVGLPGLDGLALQRHLTEAGTSLPVVFVTGTGDIPMSVRAIKAGAVDFLTKPVSGTDLLAAVRAALKQEALAYEAKAERASIRRRYAGLTEREREVLAGLAAGKLNKQIAGELGIAEATVKFHRARLMDHMQARTVAELMHFAARLELTPGSARASSTDESQDPRPQRG